MGRLLLVFRLAGRDLRRHPGDAALLLLAIMAATTTLTLGLVLHGVTNDPYESTRRATAGPDVMAGVAPDPYSDEPVDTATLEALVGAAGVSGHDGPYPATWVAVESSGNSSHAHAIGRDVAAASIDQPELTDGSWVRDGGVVVEAAFADALGVGAGDAIELNSRPFRVVGVAVSAATAPYPEVACVAGQCIAETGVIWLTQGDVRSLASEPDSLAYVVNLRLDDPAAASAFVATHLNQLAAPAGNSWQDVRGEVASLVRYEQRVLVMGGWLLGALAVASVAVLIGGRMAGQTRRVGLLKAVGGSPRLVAVVLLAEYVVVALLAAAAGLTVGVLAAPVLIDPSAGLIGRSGAPSLTMSTVGVVTFVALGVPAVATVVPALRAARTSTVQALADTVRAPRRTAWLIGVSARLPAGILLGFRVAARQPRRLALTAAGIFVTVTGIVAVLAAHADLDADQLDGFGAGSARIDRLNHVLLLITLTLIALALVNTIFITFATVLDARHSTALARALGATRSDVSTGLSTAQALPALVGAVLGVPGGITLFAVLGDATRVPPRWQLLAVVAGTVVAVAALSAIPARLGAHSPVAATLQSADLPL